MSLYLLPVVIALLIKVAIFVFVKRAGIKTQHLYGFLVMFAVHNICELGVLLTPPDQAAMISVGMRMYYAATFLLASYGLTCVLKIAMVSDDDGTKFIEKAIWLGALSGAVLSVLTDTIAKGYIQLSYTATVLKGLAYWLFQLNNSIALLTILFVLAREAFYGATKAQRVRCLRMLIAFFPMIVASLSILGLMQYGYQISAAMVIPFASTWFLITLVYSEREHRLTEIRRMIPGTQESKERSELNKVKASMHQVFSDFAVGDASFTETTDRIDSLLLAYSYEKYGGNVQQTAKFIGLGRSTLYKKMEKHDIGQRKNVD